MNLAPRRNKMATKKASKKLKKSKKLQSTKSLTIVFKGGGEQPQE
jgi:hypothetical protein